MPDNSHTLWESSLQLVRQHVAAQTFESWIAPIVFESFDEAKSTVLVQVPSMYFYEYLEQNYARLICWSLAKTFEREIKLSYRIVTDEQRAKEPEPQAAATAKESKAKQKPLDAQLDPHRTFENFIEGDSNKLSRTVGISVAEHPGRSTFNPLFVFGPSGCGKTHLINAIGVRCLKHYPKKRVLYVSSRLFQVQFTDSVRQNSTNDFINFYQSIDVLIVDDIQEWATSPRTLDTFFHIFDHLFRLGKQIVLASDRPPVELEGVKDRLLTRFSCGLIAEMEQPNVQLCIDILKAKCRRDALTVGDDVLDYIAHTANGSVRELEGVLNSLLAYSIAYNSKVDMHLAERVIKRAVKTDNQPLMIDDILEKVCQHYGVNQQAVLSKSRKRDVTTVRQVVMFLAQKYTRLSGARIGSLLGGRDHSTVVHGSAVITQRLQVEKSFREEMAGIESTLQVKN